MKRLMTWLVALLASTSAVQAQKADSYFEPGPHNNYTEQRKIFHCQEGYDISELSYRMRSYPPGYNSCTVAKPAPAAQSAWRERCLDGFDRWHKDNGSINRVDRAAFAKATDEGFVLVVILGAARLASEYPSHSDRLRRIVTVDCGIKPPQ